MQLDEQIIAQNTANISINNFNNNSVNFNTNLSA